MIPLLTCLDLLRCMGRLMPTSMWTRLNGFGILGLEHAERSYVNFDLIDLLLRNSDTWRTGGGLLCCLKAFGRSAGLGIVCSIMTNDLFERKNTDIY